MVLCGFHSCFRSSFDILGWFLDGFDAVLIGRGFSALSLGAFAASMAYSPWPQALAALHWCLEMDLHLPGISLGNFLRPLTHTQGRAAARQALRR